MHSIVSLYISYLSPKLTKNISLGFFCILNACQGRIKDALQDGNMDMHIWLASKCPWDEQDTQPDERSAARVVTKSE
jgi:hypothetical protein